MYWAILYAQVLPQEGRLLDIGCGRGILLTLLDIARNLGDSTLAPPGWQPPGAHLELAGIELQASMAAVASQALGNAANIEVTSATAKPLPPARAMLLLDVLHYLTAAEQEILVARIADALEPGGILLVREADAALGTRFLLTRAAERFCALARGHWRQGFHFRSADAWQRLLEAAGLTVTERPMWAGTPYANRLLEARKPPV